MMVNCPKCGFSQPQDQYCAKCGVDMIAFRPAEKPLLARLASNTTLQVSILVLFAIAGGLFVRQSDKEKLARAVAETPIAREAEEQEQELASLQAEANKAQLRQTVSASVSDKKSVAVAPLSQKDAATLVTAAAAGPTQPAAGSPPAAAPANSASAAVAAVPSSAIAKFIRVYYIEGQRAFFSTLLSQARQSSGDGVYAYGVLNNIDARLKASRAWHSLESNGDQPLQLNQPNIVFKGLRDTQSGQNIGFNLQITPLSHDENGTHLQIDANRVLRDSAGGFETFDFQLPESFALKPGSALVIAGVLPHRTLTDPEERLYRSSAVLRAMSSAPFRTGATDVAIVVEAR